MTRRIYPNPPIEEAILEFRFSGGLDWDLLVPARLQEKLSPSFSGKPQQQAQVEAVFPLGLLPSESLLQVRHGPVRLQFPDESGQWIASVAPRVLSVHGRRPYPGWDIFRPRVEAALAACVKITQPSGVERIGVRYINRIVIPRPDVQLTEYFNGLPELPPPIPSRLASIFTRSESLFPDGQTRLISTFATTRAPEGEVAFLLDLDVVFESGKQPISIAETMERVERLRDHEREAFEALITDRTREVFGAPERGIDQ
jgi:uncharacterized protein (TIGR04255 family)